MDPKPSPIPHTCAAASGDNEDNYEGREMEVRMEQDRCVILRHGHEVSR
jgi:hypothetical protein